MDAPLRIRASRAVIPHSFFFFCLSVKEDVQKCVEATARSPSSPFGKGRGRGHFMNGGRKWRIINQESHRSMGIKKMCIHKKGTEGTCIRPRKKETSERTTPRNRPRFIAG